MKSKKDSAMVAWDELRLVLEAYSDRVNKFTKVSEDNGIKISVDDVCKEIDNIRRQLDMIEEGLKEDDELIA